MKQVNVKYTYTVNWMTIESHVNEPEHPTAATNFPKQQNEGSISRCFSSLVYCAEHFFADCSGVAYPTGIPKLNSYSCKAFSV